MFVFSLYLHVLTVTQGSVKNLQLLQYVSYCLGLVHLIISSDIVGQPPPQICLLDYNILLNQIQSELDTPWAHAPFLNLFQQPFIPSPPHTSLLHLLLNVLDDPDLDSVTRTIVTDVLNQLLQCIPSQHHLMTHLSSISTTESVSASRSSDVLQSIMHSGSAFLDSFEDEEKELIKRVRTESGRNLGIPFECVVCHSSHVDDNSHYPGYFCRYYRLPGESTLIN